MCKSDPSACFRDPSLRCINSKLCNLKCFNFSIISLPLVSLVHQFLFWCIAECWKISPFSFLSVFVDDVSNRSLSKCVYLSNLNYFLLFFSEFCFQTREDYTWNVPSNDKLPLCALCLPVFYTHLLRRRHSHFQPLHLRMEVCLFVVTHW